MFDELLPTITTARDLPRIIKTPPAGFGWYLDHPPFFPPQVPLPPYKFFNKFCEKLEPGLQLFIVIGYMGYRNHIHRKSLSTYTLVMFNPRALKGYFQLIVSVLGEGPSACFGGTSSPSESTRRGQNGTEQATLATVHSFKEQPALLHRSRSWVFCLVHYSPHGSNHSGTHHQARSPTPQKHYGKRRVGGHPLVKRLSF